MTATAQQMENRRIWREALLSGDYAQTTATLCRVTPVEGDERRGVGHCCLGVAAAVLPDALGVEASEVRDGEMYFTFRPVISPSASVTQSGTLPADNFAEAFGLGENQSPFYRANDEDGWNFEQIASLISDDPEVTDAQWDHYDESGLDD